MKNNQKRLFVDMDGVLARFHDCIIDEDNEVRVDMMFEENFFCRLPAFTEMIEAIEMFDKLHNNIEIYILSAVANPDITRQKIAWVDEHLPFVEPDHEIYTLMGEDKSRYIRGGITPSDFLIDDYNKNLIEWQRAGGTAIKCINNINHRGTGRWGGDKGFVWDGLTVDALKEPKKIIMKLEQILNNEIAKQDRRAEQR